MPSNIKPLSCSVKALDKPRRWVTQESLEFMFVYVPCGTITDGASIPFGFRWLFPHGGHKFEPAILHDFLYSTGVDKEGRVITRKQADRLFYVALITNCVPKWRAKLLYYGVRIGGGFVWDKYRKVG